jgi:hypothetical protein
VVFHALDYKVSGEGYRKCWQRCQPGAQSKYDEAREEEISSYRKPTIESIRKMQRVWNMFGFGYANANFLEPMGGHQFNCYKDSEKGHWQLKIFQEEYV